MNRHGDFLMKRYLDKLDNIPAPGGNGCHGALLGAANLGVMAGLTDDTLAQDIRRAIPKGTRSVPDREILAAIATARRDHGGPGRCRTSGYAPLPNALPRRQFDAAKYMRAQLARSEGATDADLWAQSPVKLDWSPGPHHAVAVLDGLYAPSDLLFVGDREDRQVDRVARWVNCFAVTGVVRWPHIIPNPVDGSEHLNKSGKLSCRCDAAVFSFKYAVVEFDRTPEYLLTPEQQADRAAWEAANKGRWPHWPPWAMTDQLAFWHSMIRVLPVAMLCTSGGKSVHGWLRMACADRAAWERDAGQLFNDWLVPLGADSSCRNASRLSRLAGHLRRDTGNWQQLLYLNPEGPAA